MKRLYTLLVVLMLTAPFAVAQVTTERCFHLDKIQFLQQKQDFWRGQKLFSTAARGTAVSGGYYNLTEATYALGLGITSTPFSYNHFGVTTVNGWRFAKGLAFGVGVGYLNYDYGQDNAGWMLPVYGDVRYFIGQQKNKFFVMADGGLLVNFKDFKDNGRYFLNPGLGIIIPLTKSAQLSFSAGLYTQYDYNFTKKESGYRDSFINMKLGLLFGK
jgi:hypothetical protein